MTVQLGVVMDPIESIVEKKDTTLAMLLAAQARDWRIHYMLQPDLYLGAGGARARSRALVVRDDPEDWFSIGTERDIALGELDVILMRKDPPFDMDYINTTYLLEHARPRGRSSSTKRAACAIATKRSRPRSFPTAVRHFWFPRTRNCCGHSMTNIGMWCTNPSTAWVASMFSARAPTTRTSR